MALNDTNDGQVLISMREYNNLKDAREALSKIETSESVIRFDVMFHFGSMDQVHVLTNDKKLILMQQKYEEELYNWKQHVMELSDELAKRKSLLRRIFSW